MVSKELFINLMILIITYVRFNCIETLLSGTWMISLLCHNDLIIIIINFNLIIARI